jgi:hypothetical protein
MVPDKAKKLLFYPAFIGRAKAKDSHARDQFSRLEGGFGRPGNAPEAEAIF